MGKKSTKTKSTTTLPAWAQPLAEGAANTMSGAVNQNQPYAQETADQIRGFLPGLGDKAFGSDPGLGAANSYNQDVLGGKYLDAGNPYLQGMINQTDASVSDQVNSMFAKSGAGLGTQHAGVLGKSLADSENNLRYGNYSNERNAMGQAASLAPSLYGSQFAGIPGFLSSAQTATQLPLMGPTAGLGVGGLWAGQGTTTGTQPGGWGSDLLNAAASIGSAAIMASDRRLKTNIEKVGEFPDGLGIYDWNWKTAPNGQKVRGVIADEVEQLRPWAFVPNYRGEFAGVNYGAL